MLRTLSVHPRIRVVHNLDKTDSAMEVKLFSALRERDSDSLPRFSPLAIRCRLNSAHVLLLKQSVWEHASPFKGFVLARNPFSIYASLKFYDVPAGIEDWQAYWANNTKRLARWLKDIDPDLINELYGLTPVNQFCLFYNRRMGQLANLGLPIMFYEHFVTDPERTLRSILDIVGLEWTPDLLNAHEAFQPGKEGHGKIDLGRPLSRDSLFLFAQRLEPDEFSEIGDRTRKVCEMLDYQVSSDSIKAAGHAIRS